MGKEESQEIKLSDFMDLVFFREKCSTLRLSGSGILEIIPYSILVIKLTY